MLVTCISTTKPITSLISFNLASLLLALWMTDQSIHSNFYWCSNEETNALTIIISNQRQNTISRTQVITQRISNHTILCCYPTLSSKSILCNTKVLEIDNSTKALIALKFVVPQNRNHEVGMWQITACLHGVHLVRMQGFITCFMHLSTKDQQYNLKRLPTPIKISSKSSKFETFTKTL